nr:MAG TPA: hypothetical protein [Caudoviricetes sp.]
MLQPNARAIFGGVVILRHLFEVLTANDAAVNGCAFCGDNVKFQGMLRVGESVARLLSRLPARSISKFQ